MKKICCAALFGLIGAILLPAAGHAANVCGQGVGIPPFLSSGAKPNLLMVLDNSGSMLDASYSEDGSFCFDDSYDGNKPYAGYFQNDQWYQWSEGDYKPWQKGVTYTAPSGGNRGSIVYVQGVFWEAQSVIGASSGTSPENDTKATWKRLFTIAKWKNATVYPAKSFVWEGPQLYYTAAGGTSNDTVANNVLRVADDTGITDWKAVDSTWLKDKAYNKGDLVTYRGLLYEATNNATASGTGVYDDSGVTWKTLDEGSFVAVSKTAATSACSSAVGATDKYTSSDLCISLNNTAVPAQVPAFAARGNLLNWAMSSKFDVEKKILTGGKYNYKDDILVSEHRGCAGSRMVKQLPVTGKDAGGNAVNKFLSLGVRAARHNDSKLYEDRIDSTDDTGRLEVLAVTDGSYALSQACKDAIDTIVNHGLNGAQNDIKLCVESFPNANSQLVDMRPTLNHSLQACWQDDPATSAFEINQGHWSQLIADCKALYTGKQDGDFKPSRAYHPSELRPADGGPYLCYGVYASDLDPNNRAGYMGRCWIQGAGGWIQKSCNQLTTTDAGSTGFADLGCWKKKTTGQGTTLEADEGNGGCRNYRNNGGYVEKCNATFANNDNSSQCPSGSWQKLGKWDDDSGDCYYPQNPQQVCPPNTNCDGVWQTASWPDWEPTNGNCILEAIKDYCDTLKVPEVIDPSEIAGKTVGTGDTGNAPGLLRDSYLMAYLGGKDPIATMKGHIYQAKRPEGVVHRVAGDLRLGMMSFRYVGAKTECDQTNTSTKVEKYCPLNNMDGALLRTPLEVGDYVTSSNDPSYDSGKRRHVDDLAEAINTTRGTSWTPLAEAMYEAIGYYTQNINLCLNTDTNKSPVECMDFPTADNPSYFPTVTKSDPIEYWCQDNHILVITEGESTADINEQVKNFSGKIADTDPRLLSKTCTGTCTAHGKNACLSNVLTGDGDDSNSDGADDASCTAAGLYSSPYLDNMTWWGQHVEPLYKQRCVSDASGKIWTEKQPVTTHVVTTGTLLNSGTGECNPVTLMTQAAVNGGTNAYYPGENPQQLEDNLYAVFDDILSRSSAGSAASVISSSRSGSGAVYQAVFWPKFEDNDPDGDGKSNKVSWVGDVHSLFVNSKGEMYDDSNQNGKLDEGSGDYRILFYFSNAANKTRGCYDDANAVVTTGQCPELAATADELVPDCDPAQCGPQSNKTCKCVELQDIKYLWSANKNLADRDVASDRKLFTWNDLNNDGIVDAADEWFKLDDKVNWTALDTAAASASPARGPVSNDFLKEEDIEDFVVYDAAQADKMKTNALKTLTRWLQGVDVLPDPVTKEVKVTDTSGNTWEAKELRSRKFTFKTDSGGWATKTWRLGDIIHSTPMVVAKPAESYHYIYRDPTYNSFVTKWSGRRNMVYFGGNDGMLHAVNGGYFHNNQFCCTAATNANGSCAVPPDQGSCSSGPDLGEELWSYIPYNLQPHLKCLADRFYAHKSYVDMKPRIFDVQIFKPENECGPADNPTPTAEGCIHPGGWGTILVGAMRFGGSPVLAKELHDKDDNRKFISAYFVLDITNPESDPVLLGEMTQTVTKDAVGNYINDYADMQYTTSSPSMIIMREGGANDVKSRWYLTLGSGPADQDGANNSGAHGKIAVIPLEWMGGKLTWGTKGVPTNVGGGKQSFRIPKTAPSLSSQGGIFKLDPPAPPPSGGSSSASFISDIISVDYNIDLSSAGDDLGARYCTDAIYFGTADGTDFEKYPSSYLGGAVSQFYWKGGGRVFRLVTKIMTSKEDVNNNNILDDGEDINNNGVLDAYVESASLPSAWAGKWTNGNPLRVLADVGTPVVGAPSIGYDGWNYWVYAGTGRFFGEEDKTDDGWCIDTSDAACAQRSKAAIFGFKEPLMDAKDSYFGEWTSAHKPTSGLFACKDRVMTWEKIEWDINDAANTNDNLAYTSSSAASVPSSQEAGKRGLIRTDNILVEQNTGNLYCYYCGTDPNDPSLYQCSKTDGLTGETLADEDCFPGGTSGLIWDAGKSQYTFNNLKWYIAGEAFNEKGDGQSNCLPNSGAEVDKVGTGLDGWYHAFHDPRERNLGASALLGGLLTFTTYQPYNDKCEAEGQSYLYGIHFQTGTAWTETVFGTFDKNLTNDGGSSKNTTVVKNKMSLGRGLSTTPSMHVGSDGDNAAKAFIQTSTGEIIEVEQKNLPIKGGRSGRQNWNDRLSE